MMYNNTVTLVKFSLLLSVVLTATVVINGNIASASPANETRVQAGNGTGDIAMTVYSPKEVEILSGQSVTWYNPTAVAEPHTVSFIFDNKAKADLVAPFVIPTNSTKLSPLIPNSNTEALLTPDNTAIIAVNKRVFNPVVIDSNDKVIPIEENANYTLTGTEKYVNSGWLLPNGLEQAYPGSGNSFTVKFQNAGNYNYLCLIHPYMTGTVTVK
jgi:plastocyanin